MKDRRAFALGLGAVLAVPLAAQAQPARRLSLLLRADQVVE